MAISREKKKEVIEKGVQDLKDSQTLIFADFTGTKVNDFNTLRRDLKKVGSKLKVIKKRLLEVIFKQEHTNLDPLKYEGQIAAVFVEGELTDAASSLYRFAKEHEGFRLLGAFDLAQGVEISGQTINAIGSLPPREILLGQLVGSIVAPLRAFVYILDQKSKINS